MRLKIIHDEDTQSPRDWDNLGEMVCWHTRYNLGDIQSPCDPQEFVDNLPEGSVILNLYLYDHSGITMSTTPFNCPWDSGHVGFIYADTDKIKSEFGVDKVTDDLREKVTKILCGEVHTYDLFLRGSTWGFVLEKPCGECGHMEHVDSCWGFFGDTFEETGIKEHLDGISEEEMEEAWENRSYA